jgi:hypothetical protein
MNPYNLMCESNVEHRNSCISTSVASSMPRQCRITPRYMRVTTAAGAAGPRQNSYALVQTGSNSLSPNECILASTPEFDKTVQLWNLETNKPTGTSLHHEDYVNCTTFSADGRFLNPLHYLYQRLHIQMGPFRDRQRS